MIKLEKTKKYLVFAVVFVAVISLVIFGVIRSRRMATPNDKTLAVDKNLENSVIVQTDDGTVSKVDMASGQVISANALEKEDFSDFAGLPQLSDEQKKNSDQSMLVAGDKSQAILTITLYDTSKKPAAAGGLPILSADDYLCAIVQKICQKTDLLTKEYQGLDAKLQEDRNAFVWTAWDAKRNLLLGHIISNEAEDVSPMYECEISTGSCIFTVGYDSQKTGNSTAVIPTGAISPSLEKFVMVAQRDLPNQETGKNWSLLLYDTNNLLNPKAYDISVIIDHDENVAYDSVHSIAWSADEKKIAIGTTRRIFMFDTESGGLSLAYIAPTDSEGDFNWDSSRLFLSPDATAIAFVDTKDTLVADATPSDGTDDNANETVEDTDISLNVLKKIDLQNANKVTELLQGEGLSLKF